jgi:hypothetical protein
MTSISVRVYCRMRPFNKRELALGNLEVPIVMTGEEVTIPERGKRYAFDENFGLSATQEEVFNVIGHKVVG